MDKSFGAAKAGVSGDPLQYGLPHRHPFLFIDRVVSVEPGRQAVCEIVFPESDPVFRGHFPGNPIVPGVLLAEALAQTAGIAAGGAGVDGAGVGGRAGFLLSAIRSMKFPRSAVPGLRIVLEAECAAVIGGLHRFDVRASQESAGLVAEGTLVLSAA